MKRERTVGNRVWIGLLGFCLFVCIVLDCVLLYGLAVRWLTLRQMLALLSVSSLLTTTSFQLLRRRLSISGSDKFL